MKFSIDIKETECVPHFTDRDDPEWTPEIERQEVIQWDEIDSKCNELRASLLDETEPMARKARKVIISPRFFRDDSGTVTRQTAVIMLTQSVATALAARVLVNFTFPDANTKDGMGGGIDPHIGSASSETTTISKGSGTNMPSRHPEPCRPHLGESPETPSSP